MKDRAWKTYSASVTVSEEDAKKEGYCNRSNHPEKVFGRRYRRGKWRCLECGAKISIIQMMIEVKDRSEKELTERMSEE